MRRSPLILTLSIAALPILVNGQPQSLSTVNKTDGKSELKDSVKDSAGNFKRLVEVVFRYGAEGGFKKNLAHVVGLPGEMPTKDQENTTRTPNGKETRGCFIVYEDKPEAEGHRPVCAYILKRIVSGRDSKSQYFRVTLDGRLEKAVLSQGKNDESGKPIAGSGVKFDQDIESAEVRKAFNAEINYWLKDWLKKEQKAAGTKKAAEASKPSKKAASL